ncbi:DUF805 domain-containing protein [Sphingomonas sp. JC676]|uniref:DUF805 domain-containing protein n=1 Tax=Sphingomonas sp. JC676 TaxID=2768065 RepID=UPI001657D599|nr:DUF805 domain-containing protein [Sphingomonas sp. JC676]
MRALAGRYNRATYWLMIAVAIIVIFGLTLISKNPVRMSEFILILICVPRLHDIGKSGWLVLWGVGLEFATIVFGFSFMPVNSFATLINIATFVILGLVIWLGCIPGESGANRFGEAPLGGVQWRFQPKT